MDNINWAIARDLARLADLVENEDLCPDFLLFRVEAIMANIGLVAAEMDTELCLGPGALAGILGPLSVRGP